MMSYQGALATEAVERMAELRDNFADGLSKRIDDLSDAFGRDSGDVPLQKMSLERARDLSHSLAGTAGTYNFEALADASLDLEQACCRYLARFPDEDAVTPAFIKNIFAQVVFHATQAMSGRRSKLMQVEAWNYDLDDVASHTGRKRIIVVDDDPAMAKVLGRQLDYFGYDIEWLSDPDLLQDTIAIKTPDAIIMDIIFPGGADLGIQSISKLKASGGLQCPVIFLSVRADFTSRLAAMRAGCNAYLVKPFGVAELRDTLLNLTHRDQNDPYRVLVIDDDSEIARYNSILLQDAGMVTHSVVDPMNALFEVRRFNPDVIVMDVHMPGCDGLELAMVIRQEARFLHLPIVFLTADDNPSTSFEAFHTGGNEFLTKGIDTQILINSVRDWGLRNREFKALIDRAHHSESRYRALNQSARDAIVTIDENGRVVIWNDAAERLFGYADVGLLGRPLTEVLGKDLNVAGLNSIARRGCVAVRDNGTKVPVEFSFSTWSVGQRVYRTFIIRNTFTEVTWEEEEKSL